jgi:predicted component of viral defense system (DUF524 family)
LLAVIRTCSSFLCLSEKFRLLSALFPISNRSIVLLPLQDVAASCVWLASKLEESPKEISVVLQVLWRMERRRNNLPIEILDLNSQKYFEMRTALIRTERHLLKEMGFICHVEHPHKFIMSYLKALEAPVELMQEAWNLANDR